MMYQDIGYDVDRISKYIKALTFISILIGILMLAVIFICMPAHAAQTMNSSLNVSYVTDNSITWHIDYKTDIRATGATLDGVEIEGFNGLVARNYTATDLEPNTTHEFCIYKDLINCEMGKTLPSSSENIIDTIWVYLFAAGSLLCIIVVLGTSNVFIAIPALILAFLSFLKAGDLGNPYLGIISVILIISSIYAGFRKE